jgi:two-component system sensor kinase FixL
MEHQKMAAAGDRQSSESERLARLATAGELVGGIAHDLRQPLTALEMNVSAAIRLIRQTPPRLAEAIEALTDSLEQQHRMREALQVLEDLVNHREPCCDSFDIAPVVREVIALIRSDALARHVAIELDIQDPLPPIVGDATLVRHALLNIALAALEARAPNDRETASVGVTVVAADDAVEVAVRRVGVRHGDVVFDASSIALAGSVTDAHGATLTLAPTADADVLITRWPRRRSTPPET